MQQNLHKLTFNFLIINFSKYVGFKVLFLPFNDFFSTTT